MCGVCVWSSQSQQFMTGESDLLVESFERICLYTGELVLVKSEDFECVETFESLAVDSRDFITIQIQNQKVVEVSQRDWWDGGQWILGEIQLCQSRSWKEMNYSILPHVMLTFNRARNL